MLSQLMLWQSAVTGWVRGRVSKSGDEGASLVEYALLLALIAVVAIGALTFLGSTVSKTVSNVGNTIALGSSGGGGGTTTTTVAPQAPSYASLVAGQLQVVASIAGGNTTVSVAATGGTTPITYSGALPNGLSWNETPTDTDGIVTVPGSFDPGQYSFSVTASNGVSPNAHVTVVLTVFSQPLGSHTFTLTTSFGGNRCTVSGTYAAKSLSMSCNDWSWITSGGWYIDNGGAWTDVTWTNAQALVNAMLNATTSNWTYTTQSYGPYYVTQVVAPSGTVAT